MSMIEAFNKRRERTDPATLAENIRLIDGRAFVYDSTPFLREPTASLGDIGGVCRVVIQSPAQVGKTVTIENFLAWICEYDRQNTLLILDSDKTGKRMSKNRLRPFLRQTCGINSKTTKDTNPEASKEISNIGLAPGANLIIGSSKSASDLCSTPVKYLLCDELDRWADCLAREGDPLALAFQRQMRFPSSMALLTSTPTVDAGRIHQQYLLGTQEVWGVFCECGQWIEVKWDLIDWTNSTPVFHCVHCGTCYSEADVIDLKHGYSAPQNTQPYRDKCGRVARSFAITAPLCHSFYTWEYLRREEEAARSLGEVSYQSFKNTRLGEVYKPTSERVFLSEDVMHVSTVVYSVEKLPHDIAFIVAGVDTQDNGFAVEICGFSEDRRRVYGVEWLWLEGRPKSEPELWRRLNAALSQTYKTEDGRALNVAVTCQDSGGHCTHEVYGFSLRRRGHFAIKGVFDANELIVRMSHVQLKTLGKGTGRVLLTNIGTICGKDMVMNALESNLGGELRFLWPINSSYTLDYFDQLTAEKRIVENRGVVRWVCLPGRHNEALDCRVYALAAAEIYANKKCATASMQKSCVKSDILQTNGVENSAKSETERIEHDFKQEFTYIKAVENSNETKQKQIESDKKGQNAQEKQQNRKKVGKKRLL